MSAKIGNMGNILHERKSTSNWKGVEEDER
jgi:hypothetical protein